MRVTRNVRYGMATLAVAVALGSASAAQAQTQTRSASAAAANPTLNLVIGSVGVPYGPIWIALANNLFAKNHVNVNVLSFTGIATGSAQLVSGQADLFASSTAVGVQLGSQGQPAQTIYGLSRYTAYMFDWMAKSGITSIAQLRSMGTNCTVARGLAGSGGYAYTNQYIQANKLHCTIVNTASPVTAAELVESGQVDAAAVFPQTAPIAVAAGQGVILTNAEKLTSKQALSIVPNPFLAVGIVGLEKDLQAKSGAVVDFLRALRQAQVLMLKTSTTELAQETLKVPGQPFGTTTANLLADTWAVTLPTFPTGSMAGSISPGRWGQALYGFSNTFATPNFNSKGPAAAYGTAVNMSYFTKAGISIAAKSTPEVVGNASVGKTVKVGPVKWSVPTSGVTYQWQLCSSKCVDIAKAQSAKLKIGSKAKGKQVRVVVKGSSSTGNAAVVRSSKVAVA